MAGEVKTQGTGLYFVDRDGPVVLVKMTAPTGVSGLTGGSPDPIESTDLDATTDKEYVRGLASPTTISVPFNLKPSDASHQLLFEKKEAGELLDWAAVLSDGVGVPGLTGTAPNQTIGIPATRSGFKFKAYIMDVNIDVATNEIVRGTLTLQRSGPVTPVWKEQ